MRAQHANVWQDGNVNSTQAEFRFIVDHTVLFRAPIEKTGDKTTIGRRAAGWRYDLAQGCSLTQPITVKNKDRSQHCQNDVGDGIGHSRWRGGFQCRRLIC
jgi:hypothetical protein